VSKLSKWQREDGFPSDEYFDAVLAALEEAGVGVVEANREDDWEYNVELDPDTYLGHWGRAAAHGLYVSWRCDEMDEPQHEDDFSGWGWYYVPYSREGEALGDYAKSLDLAYIAEPREVAAAVQDVATGRGADSGS